MLGAGIKVNGVECSTLGNIWKSCHLKKEEIKTVLVTLYSANRIRIGQTFWCGILGDDLNGFVALAADTKGICL